MTSIDKINTEYDVSYNDESYIEDNDPDYTLTTKDDDDDSASISSSVQSSNSSTSSISEELSNIVNENVKDLPVGITSLNKSSVELVLQYHSKYSNFISKNEIPRKLFHSSIGFITLYLYTQGVTHKQLIIPLSTAFVTLLSVDFARLHNSTINKKICSIFWFVMRSKEVNHYNGILWYLLGIIIVFQTCPKDISLMSVLLLSWSDTAASTIGRRFGHLTPKLSSSKSLAGSFAAFVIGIVSCVLIYGYFIPQYPQVNSASNIFYQETTSKLNFCVFALLAGLIASVSEFINIFNWDDNFTIPVLSGWFLYSMVYLFHI